MKSLPNLFIFLISSLRWTSLVWMRWQVLQIWVNLGLESTIFHLILLFDLLIILSFLSFQASLCEVVKEIIFISVRSSIFTRVPIFTIITIRIRICIFDTSRSSKSNILGSSRYLWLESAILKFIKHLQFLDLLLELLLNSGFLVESIKDIPRLLFLNIVLQTIQIFRVFSLSVKWNTTHFALLIWGVLKILILHKVIFLSPDWC